ncbi:MAG: hypothetical protein EOP02_02820 [Proteobacteria bacterium]|nr:MAG: hypothetical protein EOP02_02820 [Pseudomonadota bacterium]
MSRAPRLRLPSRPEAGEGTVPTEEALTPETTAPVRIFEAADETTVGPEAVLAAPLTSEFAPSTQESTAPVRVDEAMVSAEGKSAVSMPRRRLTREDQERLAAWAEQAVGPAIVPTAAAIAPPKQWWEDMTLRDKVQLNIQIPRVLHEHMKEAVRRNTSASMQGWIAQVLTAGVRALEDGQRDQ